MAELTGRSMGDGGCVAQPIALRVCILFLAWLAMAVIPAGAAEVAGGWALVSSEDGRLPAAAGLSLQTAAVTFDVDGDGIDDVVIGGQGTGPSLVWLRRVDDTWTLMPIEPEALPLAAGGAAHDIDRDGDLDLVLGEDDTGSRLFWWENPAPNFDAAGGWARRAIKASGPPGHRDQAFGDFDGDGRAELAFWNQHGQSLLIAEVPDNPRSDEPWPSTVVAKLANAEGLAVADIDQDGIHDLVAGGRWFKRYTDGSFRPEEIDGSMLLGRVAIGQIIPGGRPEIAMVPGQAAGFLMVYVWDGETWQRSDPLGELVDHGHSLAIADIDRDGHNDVFLAEMHTPGRGEDARMWGLLGDGTGALTAKIIARGIGAHESRLVDLDGDGDLDIVAKPFSHDVPRLDVLVREGRGPVPWPRHVIDGGRPGQANFVDAGDIDGDGLLDVIAGAFWYRNPGDLAGHWERRRVGGHMRNMTVVMDFDRDNDLDILGTRAESGQADNTFTWAENDGRGRFKVHYNVEPGRGDVLRGVAVGAFEDWGLQIALSWQETGRGVQTLTVPYQPSAQSWAWEEIARRSQDAGLSAGDINGDGRLDIVLGTEWLRNTGFEWELEVISERRNPDRNRVADIDGDGFLDVIVGFAAPDKPADVVWYRNPGVGGTWTENRIATPIGPMSVDVGDVDQDGDIDVVVGEHRPDAPEAARLHLLLNADGSGRQWADRVIAVGDEHRNGARLADLDNDGDLDIVSIGASHHRVLVFENPGDRMN